ncbi:hypothetical protein BDK51DRAFT_30016 [Blyttiomyces helicus]|uniref:Uncharacterized protein n=1 Tax=Blyttiomyces helicus TaxID=388810 RepID=A0A4P9VYW6_9FUNG|nr:hypothetical protein BDK51DRAFT_30016 [Blyttiomyces helicus]|eukprot:RKO83530.1 hypothetical protein BDK51DRAFT_30016 [Blyttiomyces helicus]
MAGSGDVEELEIGSFGSFIIPGAIANGSTLAHRGTKPSFSRQQRLITGGQYKIGGGELSTKPLGYRNRRNTPTHARKLATSGLSNARTDPRLVGWEGSPGGSTLRYRHGLGSGILSSSQRGIGSAVSPQAQRLEVLGDLGDAGETVVVGAKGVAEENVAVCEGVEVDIK